MNRWMMIAAVALTVVGCAEGVEDPQPDPGPDPVQKPAPAQTFTGELDQITDNQRLGVGDLTPDLPPLPNEELPMPGQ